MADSGEHLSKGQLRESLVALRVLIAKQLEHRDLSPRELAALSREFRALVVQIDKLPGGEEKSDLDQLAESIPPDELASRRKNRQPRASA